MDQYLEVDQWKKESKEESKKKESERKEEEKESETKEWISSLAMFHHVSHWGRQ